MNFLLKRKATLNIIFSLSLFVLTNILSACSLVNSLMEFELTITEEMSTIKEFTLALPTEYVTETPNFTETSEPTATSTETITPTIEPTIVKEFPDPEIVEFDRITLNLNGNSVEFVIGTEEESNAVNLWGQVGIEALIINRNLPDYQEKFSKLILAIFWQNTGQEITFEEYLGNTDQYPIVLKSRQMNGRIFEKKCYVNDIKKIEYRIIINPKDPRLYFQNPYSSSIPMGFNYFENGTLTIYQLTRNTFIGNFNRTGWEGRKDSIGFKEYIAEMIGLGLPASMLSFPHTMPAGTVGNILFDDFVKRMDIVSDLTGYPYNMGNMGNLSNITTYFNDHGYWSVIWN